MGEYISREQPHRSVPLTVLPGDWAAASAGPALFAVYVVGSLLTFSSSSCYSLEVAPIMVAAPPQHAELVHPAKREQGTEWMELAERKGATCQ